MLIFFSRMMQQLRKALCDAFQNTCDDVFGTEWDGREDELRRLLEAHDTHQHDKQEE